MRKLAVIAASTRIVSSEYNITEIYSLITSVKEVTSDLPDCNKLSPDDFSNYENFILENSQGWSKLEMIVGDDNVIQTALEDESCYIDDISSCIPKPSTHTSFRIAATAVFTGLIGLVWLGLMVPCALCRCLRCCEGRTGRNFTPCDYRFIYFLTMLSLLGFFVTIGYLTPYRNRLSPSLTYAHCGIQSASDLMMGSVQSQTFNLMAAYDIVNGTVLSDGYNVKKAEIVDLVERSDNYTSLISEFWAAFNQTLTEVNSKLPAGYYLLIANNYNSTRVSVMLDEMLASTATSNSTSLISKMESIETVPDLVVNMVAANGVWATTIDKTTIVLHEKYEAFEYWVVRGVLGLFILLFVPLFTLCVSIRKFTFESYAKSFTDPRQRPASPTRAFMSYCATMVYAFIVLSVASAVFATSYITSNVCLVQKDVATILPNLTHLYTDNYPLSAAENFIRVAGSVLDGEQFELGTTVIDPVKNQTFSASYDDIALAITQAKALSHTFSTSEWYALSMMGSGMASTGFVISSVANVSAVEDVLGASYVSAFDTYNSSLSSTSTYNMTQDEYDMLYNLTLSATPLCGNTTITGALISSNTALTNINDAYGWGLVNDNGLVPGLNYTISLAIEYGVIPDGVTCEALVAASMSDFDTTVPAFAPFTLFLKDKIQIMQKTDFSCDNIVVEDDTVELGMQTLSVATNSSCSYNDFMATLNTNFNTSINALLDNYFVARQNLTTATTEAYNMVFVNIDLTEMRTDLNNAVHTTVTSAVNTQYGVFVESACETALPIYLMLGVGLFIFGIASLFAAIAQFFIWRRMVDNYSLWSDLRQTVGDSTGQV